jgi:hypothetical protein
MTHGPDSEGPTGEQPPSAPGTALELAAFLCELAMLVVLGIAGWGLGNGGLMSIAFCAFYPALAILIWSIWMAPRSARRLADPLRLFLQLAMFAGTAVLCVIAGQPVLGVVFVVVAAATFVATRFTGGVTGS